MADLTPTTQPSNLPSDTVITPDQLMSFLIGSETIPLRGLGGIPGKVPFWVPSVSSPNPRLVPAAVALQRAMLTRMQKISVVVAVVALAALAYFAGTYRSHTRGADASGAAWEVKSVDTNAISIRLGNSMVVVQVGNPLPNGQILRGVDPHQQSFTTDSQITVIKK